SHSPELSSGYGHLFSHLSVLASLVFFFTDPPTPEPYTLSLHDALPISNAATSGKSGIFSSTSDSLVSSCSWGLAASTSMKARRRSEEHTSELQSRFDLVCRLLLEKKNQQRERHGPERSQGE